jgi:5-methylcytosine-specific restriction endonuclease McrA
MNNLKELIKDFTPVTPGNPKIESIKNNKDRYTALSLLPMMKWTCKWCFKNRVKTHRHHYCSKDCSISAQIFCYPQGPLSRYFLRVKQNEECACCGKTFGKKERGEVDHIIPIFKGGQALGTENLQLLCQECHLSKTINERKKDGPDN